MSVLLASDLDQTLIYSERSARADTADLVCVEHYQGNPQSFMSAAAVAALTAADLVPVTTRTVEQLRRVRLPVRGGGFAIAANGGVILQGGVPDESWTAQVAGRLAAVSPLAEVLAWVRAACAPEWTSSVRAAEGMFCYAVVDLALLPAAFEAEAAEWASARGWNVSRQGRKIYWVPNPLTKGAAVREIARRLGSDQIMAAGDSLLDKDLLEIADRGIQPRHGGLFDSGWRADHVVVTGGVGVAAGHEIAEWFAAAV
ncbi:hypothetical protein [Tomitella biformata]|uniref:hypothetical protein n=1 Tax=Tomitella biformata TaxID=630403 RepID=UPI00046660D3|nr:hypothetical protein [Tomitella biformata]